MGKKKKLTLNLIEQEAARCLLCYDAPCSKACPGGISPDIFIRSLRFGNLAGAIANIRKNSSLGAICSESCPEGKYCEGACIRNKLDRKIDIKKIQNFLMTYDLGFSVIEKEDKKNMKIAILGSGPVELASAGALSQKGYEVTVFERDDLLGQWLNEEISGELIQKDIEYLKDLGVEFKINSELKKSAKLKEEGYTLIISTLDEESEDDVFILPKITKEKSKIIFSIKYAKEMVNKLDEKLTNKKQEVSDVY
jgi:dihydropyrimidine dehydrogenase (NAD+) subunit PreT